MLKNLQNKLNLKTLFLIDSLGALLSAFMLGIILARFEDIFGMPQDVLYLLAGIACIFSVYSFCGFLGLFKNRKPYLKAIAIANLLYCCLTLALLIFYYEKLTAVGLVYFGLEMAVVVVLVTFELKMSNRLIMSN